MPLIKNFSQLATTKNRNDILMIVQAGLEAIQPNRVIAAQVRIKDFKLRIQDRDYNLREYHRVFLVAFGKGSAEISKLVVSAFADSSERQKFIHGWVIDTTVEQLTNLATNKLTLVVGTHPLPSQTNVDFTRQLVSDLTNHQLTKDDLVIVVVCGGGSAMLTDPTVPLSELITTNERLLKSGLTIAQMNAARSKIDRVKSGGLAQMLSPTKIVSLIFSDVPGNDLSVVASGPTVADPPLPNVDNILILSNLTALEAMKAKAKELGYSAEILTATLQEEAREVGARLIRAIKDKRYEILLAGGETTVSVKGDGQGGRNQELVLGFLRDLSPTNLTVVSVDSDGWDNSQFAGAIGDHITLEKAKNLSLDPNSFLENNDAYTFFAKVDDAVVTGRLPSNVADLVVILKSQ